MFLLSISKNFCDFLEENKETTHKNELSDGEENKEGDDLKTVCGFDPTFHVALVYAYGSFEAYSTLETKLFPSPETAHCEGGGRHKGSSGKPQEGVTP